MKKVICLLIVLSISVSMSSALAAGKLSVEQENFYAINEYGVNGYVFAKIVNTGNKDIQVNNVLLEIFDSEGDALTSTDWASIYGKYLAPGEYCYLRIVDDIGEGIDDPTMVDDYMLTVSGKSTTDGKTIWLETSGEYKENVQEGYWTYNYMYGTITNNTDQDLYEVRIAMALLDEDDNILYLYGDGIGYNCALNAGSSVTFRVDVDDDFIHYFEKNNLVPASIDVIAYAYVEEY